MALSIVLGNQNYIIQAEHAEDTHDGLILFGDKIHITIPESVISYFRHGWQSWSLAAWLDTDFQLPTQKPDLLHPLQIDPLYAKHPAPNGSWLGAVRFKNGNVLLLGALGLDAHVALHGQELHGWYEAGSGQWLAAYGEETSVFKRYTDLLGERLGKAPGKPSPRVWCSWYSLYTAIDEALLYRVIDELSDLPFDVLQVDDGWQVSVGDWEANNKFPSGMPALAEKIKATGRQAGLWLAPLITVKSSRLFREHPEWFLKDQDGRFASAGFNWGEPIFALDTTHPAVLDWLATLMKQVRKWGYDYLKLDFLYAGALPGKRHLETTREEAYRQGLKVMREAMGTDAYFLTCGAPIIPSLGLCDAMRIGPDVAGTWESYRDATLLYNPTTPGTKNAIRTTVNRLWLSPLVATDPDVAYFRSKNVSMGKEQKQMLQNLALVCNYKATSDLPGWLSATERKCLHDFLESSYPVHQIEQYKFALNGQAVDFSPAMPLPEKPTGLNVLLSPLMGWIGNQRWALKLFHEFGKREVKVLRRSID